jgi:glycine/D-amino acid oxidase-like deaminating enzyme
MAGIALPVRRRKRTNFVFRTAAPMPAGLPLTIEPNGVWYRPEGEGFICGCSPADDADTAADDFEPRYEEFDEVIWPTLAARSAGFEAIRLERFWAGHYDMNLHDRNAIIGPLPGVANMLIASGFSGHGLQQSPAVGRGLAEWIVHGRYLALDLTPLGHARLTGPEARTESNVI